MPFLGKSPSNPSCLVDLRTRFADLLSSLFFKLVHDVVGLCLFIATVFLTDKMDNICICLAGFSTEFLPIVLYKFRMSSQRSSAFHDCL